MKLPIGQICYLCGTIVLPDGKTSDHVPPKQIYPSDHRAEDRVKNLLTLATHGECNMGYQRDEDYFVHSFAPLVYDSPAGKVFWKDFAPRLQREENKGLTEKVRREFWEVSQGGILLPPGKVLKYYDGDRVRRVIWKICRGLFFKEYGRFLPEGIQQCQIIIVDPDYPPPDEFTYVRDTPSRGKYPAFFDYKYLCVKELHNFHYWAFLFWDKLIATCAFHDPDCICEKCSRDQATKTSSEP